MLDHLQQAEALAKSLGDRHRLGRIATLMIMQCRATGDYDAALKFGQEALTIARTLGDRSIEWPQRTILAICTAPRASTAKQSNCSSGTSDSRVTFFVVRFGTPADGIGRPLSTRLPSRLPTSAGSTRLSDMAKPECAIAEENDHRLTLFIGLLHLGWVHSLRGDFSCAARVLERGLDLGRTWQFVDRIPDTASLGVLYAAAGRTDESLALVAGAVKASRARQGDVVPAHILFCAGRAYLAAGRVHEATDYAREALVLTRQLGLRGMETLALSLTADIVATSGTENSEGYYDEALALAETRGMKSAGRSLPLRSRQTSPPQGRSTAGRGAPHHRDSDVPRNGNDLLAGAAEMRQLS